MGGWVDDTLVIMDDQAEGIVLDEERVIHGFEDKSLGECMYRVLVHLGGKHENLWHGAHTGHS